MPASIWLLNPPLDDEKLDCFCRQPGWQRRQLDLCTYLQEYVKSSNKNDIIFCPSSPSRIGMGRTSMILLSLEFLVIGHPKIPRTHKLGGADQSRIVCPQMAQIVCSGSSRSALVFCYFDLLCTKNLTLRNRSGFWRSPKWRRHKL